MTMVLMSVIVEVPPSILCVHLQVIDSYNSNDETLDRPR